MLEPQRQGARSRPLPPAATALSRRGTDGDPLPSLDEIVSEISDLRPLPEVAQRILTISEQDDFSLQDLALVVSADQALTAKILRVANSPFHRHARQVGTIRDAVVLLGFRTVRSTALTACLMDSSRSGNEMDYAQFWQFSVCVGLIAELLAGRDPALREQAFTAGVMHNLGRLALDQIAPGALARSVALAHEQGTDLRRAERELLGFSETQLGAALAIHWNYPPQLVAAIAGEEAAQLGIEDPGTLSSIVRAARDAALAASIPDGLPASLSEPVEASLQGSEQLRAALDQLGGADGVRALAETFLDEVYPEHPLDE